MDDLNKLGLVCLYTSIITPVIVIPVLLYSYPIGLILVVLQIALYILGTILTKKETND
jgi:hypothetical protein